MIRHKGSWIITSIIGYFILASLSCIFHDTLFWNAYFWYVTLGFGIMSLFFNFKEKKTQKEMSYISFAIIYKVFCLMYYTIGLSLNKLIWLDKSIFFISSICLSSLIGMIIHAYKYEK